MVGALEAAPDGADLGNAVLTHFVLIALGVLIAVLTVVSALGMLPSLRIVPDDTHFDFTQFRRISFPISATLSIIAIILFFTHGLNFGIDFKGGTLLEVQSKSGSADIATIESAAEIGKLMRRKRVKSKWVSSGTIRSDGNRPSALTTVSTAIRTPSAMRTKWVKAAFPRSAPSAAASSAPTTPRSGGSG